MPIYPFRCCGEELTTSRSVDQDTIHKTCPTCGEAMNRVFSAPAFHRFPEHFNPSVGKVVGSKREFANDLKRASEEATIRTGIPHNYVPVDLPSKPVEGPGTESQARKHRELGTPGFERKKSYL